MDYSYFYKLGSLTSIVLFNIVLYYRTINFDLVMDDHQWWERIRRDGLISIFKINSYKVFRCWIADRFYGGTTFGTNLKVEHAFTLFLHTITCVLIYVAFGRSTVSFEASILYSCNPINNQTAVWLNGRRYSINIIICLLIIISPWLFPLYLFGLALQPSAFFVWILLKGIPLWIYALPVIGLLVFGKEIYIKIERRYQDMAKGDRFHLPAKNAIVVVKTYGFYFFKMLIPGVCAMIYPTLFQWRNTKEGNENAYSLNLDFYKGTLAILLTMVSFYLIPNGSRLLFVFMFLSILQWCNVVPAFQVVADRYCSLPNVFMMFFLAYFLNAVFGRYAPIPVVLICTYYCVGLSVVLRMYRNLIYFYNYHILYFPGNPSPRTDFITSLMSRGMFKEAEYLVYGGLRANQKDYSLLVFGAIMCLTSGKPREGLIFIENAEKNFYLGREVEQKAEIEDLRYHLNFLLNGPERR